MRIGDGEQTPGDASEVETPSLRARAGRATILSVLGQAASQILRLGGNLVLARLLFPEAFGLMAIVYLVIFALEQVSNVGISAAIMRFDRGEEREFVDTAWTMQVVRGIALWLIAVSLTPFVAEFYRLPELRAILPVAAFTSVLMGLTSTKLMVLNRRLELSRIIAIELTAQAAALVLMVSIAFAYHTVWALVLGGLLYQVVSVSMSHFAVPGRLNRFAWNAGDARSIYSLGKWVIASSGISFLLAQIDIAMLGRLIPTAVLGVYSMGLIIPNLLRDLSFRLASTVVAPIVAESNRESPEALRSRYAATRRLTLPTALLMALGAAAVGPAFFHFLYDDRYVDAGWICQLALLRFWFAYLQVSGCITLLSIGHAREWAISNVFGLLGATSGCLLGFDLAELPGLLIGMGMGASLGAIVPLYRLHKLGIASPLPEIGYTALGVGFGAVLFAISAAPELVPLPNSVLQALLLSGLALLPLALFTARRILPKLLGV